MPAGADGFRLSYTLQGRACAVEFHQAKTIIGRGVDCDLTLPLSSVSRRHAVIQQESGGWMIWDLQSSNGTFLNRRRVNGERLQPGDQITLSPPDRAPVTLTFQPLRAAGTTSGVVFDDRPDPPVIRASLNFEEGQRAATAAPAVSRGGLLATPSALGERRQASLVQLFKQVGEILLSCTALEELLQRVLDLARERLGADRGCICLCDAAAERFTLTVTRADAPTPGESLTISRSIVREAIHSRQSLLVSDARSDARFAVAESVLASDIWTALCAPLQHAGRVLGVIYVDRRQPQHPFSVAELELLTALGGLAAVGVEQVQLQREYAHEKAVRARLARYSSPNVVERIAANVDPLGDLAVEDREATVLFCDLCDFTPLAEGMPPAAVADLLNEAFERLTHAVFLHDGTLDKYLGDGLMAIFGAPLAQPDHAERAVLAALLMQRRLAEFSAVRPEAPPLRMRIGINTGRVVAGDIGSANRKDYTVIGDAVNVASRLESSVAEPGQIVIGQATYELVKERFHCVALDEVRLKGRQQAMRAYRVEPPPAPPGA